MRSVIPALIAISLASCAKQEEPAFSPSSPASAAYDDEVEVRNSLTVPVNVKGVRSAGGAVLIGTVRANAVGRFVLPERGIQRVYAETDDGRTVGSTYRAGSAEVSIRRIPASQTE